MKRITLALLTALTLAACQQGAKAPAEPNPDAKPGLALADGRLVLPAVKGNPGAAYFTLTNGGSAPASLAAIYIEGSARAEMHETNGNSMAPLTALEVKPGETVKFEPGGKHVMVFELEDKVAVGATIEATLTFADGDKLSAPLKVEPVGGGHGDMDMPH